MAEKEDRSAAAGSPAKKRVRDEAPIRVVGAKTHPVRDVYHAALRLPWTTTLVGIVLVYLALNAAFAFVYAELGGIANAHPHSFLDAFFFSVQTLGTLGYGNMYPESTLSNTIVVVESVVGMMFTAVSTGLVFAKFSRSNARIVFSDRAVVSPMDGTPTLMFRLGNDRESLIYEATVRLAMIRTERTQEGRTFYRLHDLPLVRDRSPAMARSFTVMHRIDETSPLFGADAATLARDEIELIVTISGTDDTSLQPVHARHTYYNDEIRWNARHADILREEGGVLVVDLRRFHEVEDA
jgi:inward rectifier potassium channel